MPGPELLLAFLGASVLVTLAPGPDNLMVLSLSLSRGRPAGLGFGIGCALGCLTHTVWAALGIGALVLASAAAFTALKLAGAAYLIWLGVNAWRQAGPARLAEVAGGATELTTYLRRGFIANAVNPKVVLFFVAFLPQFADPARGPLWTQMLALGLLFAVQTALIFGAVALFAGRIGARLQRQPRLATWLDRCAGLIFIGLALRLATATR